MTAVRVGLDWPTADRGTTTVTDGTIAVVDPHGFRDVFGKFSLPGLNCQSRHGCDPVLGRYCHAKETATTQGRLKGDSKTTRINFVLQGETRIRPFVRQF